MKDLSSRSHDVWLIAQLVAFVAGSIATACFEIVADRQAKAFKERYFQAIVRQVRRNMRCFLVRSTVIPVNPAQVVFVAFSRLLCVVAGNGMV